MQELKFVVIGSDGEPLENFGPLPEVAQEVCAANAAFYKATGFKPPWVSYLALREDELVGTCAFKGVPLDGRAEIAYFTFPEYEGCGIGTTMARQLVEIARRADRSITVIAHTLPEKNASGTLLTKLGFKCLGPVEDPDDGIVWQWMLPPGPFVK